MTCMICNIFWYSLLSSSQDFYIYHTCSSHQGPTIPVYTKFSPMHQQWFWSCQSFQKVPSTSQHVLQSMITVSVHKINISNSVWVFCSMSLYIVCLHQSILRILCICTGELMCPISQEHYIHHNYVASSKTHHLLAPTYSRTECCAACLLQHF